MQVQDESSSNNGPKVHKRDLSWTEKLAFTDKAVYAFSFYFTAQTIFVTTKDWKVTTFTEKLSAIETLNLNIYVLILSSELFVITGKSSILKELVESKYFQYENDQKSAEGWSCFTGNLRLN
ncbi:uncharacterized protein LOC120354104 [Nilaparvata lugens]|uniref:uncharacterized protein LOC120354104 n=1 Tax=Nilaparvata lugens TaxID=108931 RepID=UPI00193E6552|nr:uncharacterized protein LOC120354104 [Nilaparvata lugens]